MCKANMGYLHNIHLFSASRNKVCDERIFWVSTLALSILFCVLTPTVLENVSDSLTVWLTCSLLSEKYILPLGFRRAAVSSSQVDWLTERNPKNYWHFWHEYFPLRDWTQWSEWRGVFGFRSFEEKKERRRIFFSGTLVLDKKKLFPLKNLFFAHILKEQKL